MSAGEGNISYRFLELLQELMCLLFLCPVRPRLHRVLRCQHGRKGLYPVGGHDCGTERGWSDDGGEEGRLSS